ncbi:hypothetical protein C1645_737860 [Glomus cerebriforme]|uniref:Uncharacterized protein n=1 Tax=Glomus cerebriforme TaxID=658196 RepID=A0A397T0P1_9GLOM|nr:hypothetical protein C1645_737860 [Glomus cerebriforme]
MKQEVIFFLRVLISVLKRNVLNRTFLFFCKFSFENGNGNIRLWKFGIGKETNVLTERFFSVVDSALESEMETFSFKNGNRNIRLWKRKLKPQTCHTSNIIS